MDSDPRCCGTGTCIINAEGVCWCGQVWNGEKMCMPILKSEIMKLEDTLNLELTKENAISLKKT
jgi:hypothetical protein